MSAEPVDPTDPILLTIDSRKRLTLGSLAHHTQYLAVEEDDGGIRLEPAEVVTLREMRFWARHPDVKVAVEASQADPNRARHPRPRRVR